MNESLEELKQIIEDAPSNVNHLVRFKSFDPYYLWHLEDINNLDDLRRIIKLEEENQRLRNQIQEMSELCLTNGEVDKIKADAIRGALKHLDNKQRFSGYKSVLKVEESEPVTTSQVK